MDKASAINIKKRKMISNNSQMNFPIKKDKLNKKPKASQSPNVVKNYEKKIKSVLELKVTQKIFFLRKKAQILNLYLKNKITKLKQMKIKIKKK